MTIVTLTVAGKHVLDHGFKILYHEKGSLLTEKNSGFIITRA